MIIEIESEYLETVNDEADEIMGACDYLDDMIDRLKEEPPESERTRRFVADLEDAIGKIRSRAEHIRTA